MSYGMTTVILLAAVVLTMAAQAKVSSAFSRYSKIRNRRGISGAEAARAVLDANGLEDVAIEQIGGSLSDHYDPRRRVLRLSGQVYGAESVAAVSVACHEAGHAIQHAESYAPLKIRNGIVPVAGVASRTSWLLIFIGIALLYSGNHMGDLLLNIGAIAFAAVVAFHAATLPVEFDASRRAIEQMELHGIIDGEEDEGARKVLGAAAMTYVASLAIAVANLLRILAMRGRD